MTSNWLELVAFSRSMIVIPNQANDNDLWTYWEKKLVITVQEMNIVTNIACMIQVL